MVFDFIQCNQYLSDPSVYEQKSQELQRGRGGLLCPDHMCICSSYVHGPGNGEANNWHQCNKYDNGDRDRALREEAEGSLS